MEILVIQQGQENSMVKNPYYSNQPEVRTNISILCSQEVAKKIAAWQIKQYVSMIFEKYLMRTEIFTRYKIHYGKGMQEAINVSCKVCSPSTQLNNIS
jgi:hypothetical protein